MTPKLILADLISHLLAEMARNPSVAPSFERRPTCREVWSSLLFCILSSQVRTSTAERAVAGVLGGVPFFEENVSSTDVYATVRKILVQSDIRYRFPEVRSRQIAQSWFAFAQVKECFYEYLDSFPTQRDARFAVSASFPGLGLKQASMFLRDIGYADRLCVIDTHILWYYSRVCSPVKGVITTKRYLEVEEDLLETSDAFGVTPNLFDSAVWAAVKTYKSRQCMMLFA